MLKTLGKLSSKNIEKGKTDFGVSITYNDLMD